VQGSGVHMDPYRAGTELASDLERTHRTGLLRRLPGTIGTTATINGDGATRHGARQEAGGEGTHMTHVLVVDDDPEIRAVLRCALQAAGHAVMEAADGVSALDRLRASPNPLIVLLDLRMPRLDGAGVLATVAGDRALVHRHQFVLVTADPLPLPPALDALLASVDVPVVSKPFDIDTVLDLVAHLADDAHPPQRAYRTHTTPARARVGRGGHRAGAASAPGRARSPSRPRPRAVGPKAS
jgi:CheY-like chemotaxis protein